MQFTARGPALAMDTTLHITQPTQELLRAADTQVGAEGAGGSHQFPVFMGLGRNPLRSVGVFGTASSATLRFFLLMLLLLLPGLKALSS
jgi:hypothetical protein